MNNLTKANENSGNLNVFAKEVVKCTVDVCIKNLLNPNVDAPIAVLDIANQTTGSKTTVVTSLFREKSNIFVDVTVVSTDGTFENDLMKEMKKHTVNCLIEAVKQHFPNLKGFGKFLELLEKYGITKEDHFRFINNHKTNKAA